MERATDALRANGEGFSMQLMTLTGRAIDADGRAIGGRAVLRLRDVTGSKRELAELNARHEKLLSEVEFAPHPDRCAAFAGLGARQRRRAHLRQLRLCPRGRSPRLRPMRVTRALELLNRPAREEASRVARLRQHLCRAAAGHRRRQLAAPST